MNLISEVLDSSWEVHFSTISFSLISVNSPSKDVIEAKRSPGFFVVFGRQPPGARPAVPQLLSSDERFSMACTMRTVPSSLARKVPQWHPSKKQNWNFPGLIKALLIMVVNNPLLKRYLPQSDDPSCVLTFIFHIFLVDKWELKARFFRLWVEKTLEFEAWNWHGFTMTSPCSPQKSR